MNILENKVNDEYPLSKDSIEEWTRVGDMKRASLGHSSVFIDSRLGCRP